MWQWPFFWACRKKASTSLGVAVFADVWLGKADCPPQDVPGMLLVTGPKVTPPPPPALGWGTIPARPANPAPAAASRPSLARARKGRVIMLKNVHCSRTFKDLLFLGMLGESFMCTSSRLKVETWFALNIIIIRGWFSIRLFVWILYQKWKLSHTLHLQKIYMS